MRALYFLNLNKMPDQIPEITNQNIENFLNREDIIVETANQIMKDFGLFGIEITFSGQVQNAYHELMEQLVVQIETLLFNDRQRLYSILYQVDISDKEISRTARELPDYTQIQVIAHQIIARDLKKVMLRHYFSGKL